MPVTVLTYVHYRAISGFSIDETSNETAIAGATEAPSVITVNNLSAKQTSFKVRVTAADGREGNATVEHIFFAELEPVIIAPRFVVSKVNQSDCYKRQRVF